MVDFFKIFQDNISIQSFIESIPEGVVFIDSHEKIIAANEKVSKLFGYTANELLGKPLNILLPEHFRTSHSSYIKNYLKNPRIRPMGSSGTTFSARKKDGSEFFVEIGLSFIDAKDSKYGIALITDISERVEAEKELKRRNIELDTYAHTVAHELHSQLNTIIGFSQVLLNDSELDNEKRTSFLKMIVSSGYKMHSTIKEMLLFANQKKEEIAKHPLHMRSIVEEALKRISPSEKNRCTISIASKFEPSVGYAPWVEEVWYNYIQNAIKYGGIPPKIEIGSSKTDNGYAKFWIKDNGSGLSEKECDLIFTDVQKLGNDFVKGHGLGLSIVKRIVKKLNGWVKVESTLNEGSTFSFFLPGS